jgi:hypothetical protein
MVKYVWIVYTSSMFLGLFLILGLVFIVGALLLAHEIRNAPVGYEDENGFHLVKEEQVNLSLCSSISI